MPRHRFGQEAFHMDHLRSTPSQQHLDPNSRSSTSSQQDHEDLDQEMANNSANLAGLRPGGELGDGQRPHKLDLYSIPVFLLECLVLGGLGYSAYFLHFKHKLSPLLSGFYCDDTSLRQPFTESKFTQQFIQPENELTVILLLLVVPLVVIVFCELVNSMFGSLKFRQIRSLCKCCKLHSITRRTLRFSAAYLLGFLIVMISCDILATSAGRFRPYLAQECPAIYDECFKSSDAASARTQEVPNLDRPQPPSSARLDSTRSEERPTSDNLDDVIPLSPPISSNVSLGTLNDQTSLVQVPPSASTQKQQPSMAHSEPGLMRAKRDASSDHIFKSIIERKWISLDDANLKQLCQFRGDSVQSRKFDLIAMSWPSFPGAILTYACIYLACYLGFVGTARPLRLITSVLIVLLLLAATIFNVQLVKEHYNHWEDVAGGAGLALVVVVFVLHVYLNKFRDTHYYENQKLYGSVSRRQQQLYKSLMMMSNGSQFKLGYTNEAGQYHLDKVDGGQQMGAASAPTVQNLQNGTDNAGATASQNDLAMRYFQIPRANYRGAPRPLSSMNRM